MRTPGAATRRSGGPASRATSGGRPRQATVVATSRSAIRLIRRAAVGCAGPTMEVPVVEMELTVPRVANGPPLVDQNEARPIVDAVCIPGAAVVVLRIRIGNPLPAERQGEVALVVLPGVGWELWRMNADDREPTLPIAAVVCHERRHRARAVAAGEHAEVEQNDPPVQLREPQRPIGVEPARIAQLGRRGAAHDRDRPPDRRGGARDDAGQQQHSDRRVRHQVVAASGAAPKLTLNRRHQMDTARYRLRSRSAGTS